MMAGSCRRPCILGFVGVLIICTAAPHSQLAILRSARTLWLA